MMEPSTWEVVLRGVGGTLQAVDKVLNGEVQNAFVACRPPGHHAETERAMGFCLFNNISIGARHAQRSTGCSGSRSSISTCITATARRRSSTPIPACSTRRRIRCRCFPAPVPWAKPVSATSSTRLLRPATAAAELREAFEDRILPALDTFRPELIIVSAGFDAHERDPLGSLRMTADDFAWVDTRTDEVGGEELRRPSRRGARRRLRPSGTCGFGERPRRRTDERLDRPLRVSRAQMTR